MDLLFFACLFLDMIVIIPNAKISRGGRIASLINVIGIEDTGTPVWGVWGVWRGGFVQE